MIAVVAGVLVVPRLTGHDGTAPTTASLVSVAQGVTTVRAGKTVTPTDDGTILAIGDTVRTAPGGEAEIRSADGQFFRLGGGGSLSVRSIAAGKPSVQELTDGRMWVSTGDAPAVVVVPGGQLQVRSRSAAVAACQEGTCTFLSVEGASTYVAGSTTIALAAPGYVKVGAGAVAKPAELAPDQVLGDPWLRSNAARDVRLGLRTQLAYAATDPESASILGRWKLHETTGTTTIPYDHPGDAFWHPMIVQTDCGSAVPCALTVDVDGATSPLAYDHGVYSGTLQLDKYCAASDAGKATSALSMSVAEAPSDAAAGGARKAIHITGSYDYAQAPRPACNGIAHGVLDAVPGEITAADFPNDTEQTLFYDIFLPQNHCRRAAATGGSTAAVTCTDGTLTMTAYQFDSSVQQVALYKGWVKKSGVPYGYGGCVGVERGESNFQDSHTKKPVASRELCYRTSAMTYQVIEAARDRVVFVITKPHATHKFMDLWWRRWTGWS